jgi:hypothetical protein
MSMTCLWPGLSRLWLRGEAAGLVTATAFAGLLDLVLAASFIWPELLPSRWLLFGWLLLASSWCLSTWNSFRRFSEFYGELGDRGRQDLFIQAQTEYLRGHWCEAESLLQRLVRDGRDVEARLMLASLFRHTKRWEDARRQLKSLERLDGAEKWRLEVERERRLLDRLRAANGVGGSTGEDSGKTGSRAAQADAPKAQ